jgi:HPt (histidine-containing phosphotransfer) domain-containing protein
MNSNNEKTRHVGPSFDPETINEGKTPEPTAQFDKGNSGKGYSLHELNRMSTGNEGFLNHALGIFIESSEEAIDNFRKFLEEKNWKKIRDTAHKILPSYRHLEVKSVIPRLVEINTKVLADKTVEVSQIVNEVIAEMEALITEIKKDLNQK